MLPRCTPHSGDVYLVLSRLKLGDIAVTAGRFFLRAETLKTPEWVERLLGP